MAANIVHFGIDNCCRLLVLRSAGYTVDDCPSVARLSLIFEQRDGADAVILSDGKRDETREAIEISRSCSSVPIILFESSDNDSDKSVFDLVIPLLSSPGEWLQRIAATIEQSRTLLAQSKLVREQSSLLLSDSAALRQKSALERERAKRERARIDESLRRAADPTES